MDGGLLGVSRFLPCEWDVAVVLSLWHHEVCRGQLPGPSPSRRWAVYCSPVKPSPLPVTGNEVWWERSQAHLVQITWDSFQGPRDRAE